MHIEIDSRGGRAMTQKILNCPDPPFTILCQGMGGRTVPKGMSTGIYPKHFLCQSFDTHGHILPTIWRRFSMRGLEEIHIALKLPLDTLD